MKSLDSELAYQDAQTSNEDRKDMIEDFHVGDGLSAIQYNLDKAREEWYKNASPHESAMSFIRKITAIGIKLGIANGMPMRETKQ